MFLEEGQASLPKYEEFLRLTGRDTCENVARRSIGRDLKLLISGLKLLEAWKNR